MFWKGKSQATQRATLFAALVAIWVAVVAGRLVHLQVVRHAFYKELSDRQISTTEAIRAPRGAILDRGGRTLALSVPVQSVVVNPKRSPEPAVAAGILAPILGLNRGQLEVRLAQTARQGKGFLWIKRKISYEEAERLRSLRLDWIEFRAESLRAYPKGVLAAHLLGGVDFEERGNGGIEQSLDRDLRGTAGLAHVVRDVVRRGVDSQTDKVPVPGTNVILTIDERLQHVAERELAKAVEGSHSQTGSVVAMDPKTGEILALASYPPYDPNLPPASEEDKEKRANHAVSVPFEPGSVFKVITVAAALETTRLTPDTVLNCGGGRFNLFGRVIHDHDSYSALSVADILAKSSNIGAIQIGLTVGEPAMLSYVKRFGFGRETGLPLPGESSGKVRELKDWSRTSIGSVAMGHEISATSVQLAQAIAAVANNGMMPKPHIVYARQRPGGKPERPAAEAPRPVLKPETAITMRRLMEGVVLHGTGKSARLQGYTSGGKTGTAQIFDPVCRCYTHKYNASFAGFSPVANPAVVVAVTINGASVYGATVAAPVFREVATAALRLRNVPKDLPDNPPPREGSPADVVDLAIADLGPPAPLLPEPRVPDRKSKLELWGPKVPDFSGMTLSAVVAESGRRGLPVDFAGSGIARLQTPPPGSVLPAGGRILVHFAR